MSMTQLSVFFQGPFRYLWLAIGLVLAVVFTYKAVAYLTDGGLPVMKGKWKSSLSLKRISLPDLNELGFIASVYVIAFAALSVWSMVQVSFFSQWSQDTTENQAAIDQLMNMGGRYSMVVLSIIIVFIGPVMEELLFRGVFFKAFKKNQKSYLTMLFSGLLFGLYHLGSYTWVSLLDLPPYLILGMALAFVYQKTDKLSSSILLHVFHNGWVQILTLYMLLK
ncbi:CPBP family intramembrane metalloprotease [Fructobacillus sp. W13]|uniref:CPBP family intramembrane metalloprotease n=1 Tax=Fructobacillus apis TaxID=2935017 RepID=A0ABT0ZPQ2_9LACO|nr:type II CAAX endopeptidase family protein [Fructobacillus apis]MCO0831970.1 CPBP family intramembrane metalloprotease [Fructobacillus apis]